MKTKFNEKLSLRKIDNLFELEISDMLLLKQELVSKSNGTVIIDSYSVFLNRRSAKLLCKKLQNLIKNGNV